MKKSPNQPLQRNARGLPFFGVLMAVLPCVADL